MPNDMKDLTFALRQLHKSPGFTFIAVLVLALGIGANTAIFSVVNAVLLRPLPYPHSEQLVLLRERLLGPAGFESGSVGYMNYLDWRAAQKSFTDLALARAERVSLSALDGKSAPEAIRAARVTGNYLSIFQVPPLIGRDFVESDDVPGAAKVALVSERVLRTRFGASLGVVGQRLNVDGVPRAIIGALSERVRFPRSCDIFLPVADLRAERDFLARGNHYAFSATGRLRSTPTLVPPNVPRFQETNIDGLVLGITTVISVLGGLLVGIWPAFRVSNTASVASELHEESARGTSGAQRQRARGVLVIAQVALAVVLLAAAGLTLKSFWRSQQVPLGFDPRGVLTMTVALPPARYDSPEKIVRFYDQLLEKVRRLPGVSAAAICNNAPFDHEEWDSSFHITGTPPDRPGQEPVSEMAIVSPDYFRALGMSILRGRDFGLADVSGRPATAMIDELAARKFFPGVDPIGRQIDDPVTTGDSNAKPIPVTIVGIVPHTRNNAPGDKVDVRNLPMMYFSASQFAKTEQVLIVRAQTGLNPP